MISSLRHGIVGFIRSRFKVPLKIQIRAQLTALVSIVALTSLIILAVITGVYFTANYKSLRADRLHVAAQLKSSQIDQNLNYLYYQCYWLASRDTLQDALTNYMAGNKTQENWSSSSTVLDKFLGSSDLFSAARMYDSNFQDVLNATNNGSGNLIPDDVLTELFPLSSDIALSSSLESSGILTDPVLNGTGYLMSMSLPIFANPSILLTNSETYGYITVVMSADGLMSVFNDTTALDKSTVIIVSAVYTNNTISGFHLVLPPSGDDVLSTKIVYPINQWPFIATSFSENKGGSIKKEKNFIFDGTVAVGYSPCSFNLVSWLSVVTQPESVFLSPSTKLTKIITGTVIAIAVVMCLITLPLSYWAVQPIVRLQKATEIITAGRGLRSENNSTHVSRSDSTHRRTSTVGSFASGFGAGREEYFPSYMNENNSDNEMKHKNSSHLMGMADTELRRIHSNTPVSTLSESHSFRSERFITSTNLIEARVPVYRRLFSDELSELTDTFNTMTDELDRHYALLEDRVRARTKQLEAAKIEAEAANEAKTVFIANISHELRTPLNGILGMTAIAMAENDIQKVKNSLKLIFRSGELLLHILTELLTFSKNVLKRTKLEERNFSIIDIALQVKSIFGKLAKDQHVKLSIILTPNFMRTMVLWGDSNRIIQIVMNLVSNALKFTPVDGEVNLRFKLLGEYDQAKSKSCNFTEVVIKAGTEIEDDGVLSPSVSNSTGVQEMIERKEDFETPVTAEKSDSSNNETSFSTDDTKETDNESDEKEKYDEPENNSDDDNAEIETLESSTTSSYDNAIFQSQFRKVISDDEDDNGGAGRKMEEQKTWVISMEVEDTGPGIEPSLQESVFEPFVQGDQTLSRQYGGTGLGLSICRQLAGMMRGTMKLESKMGVGSKFTFTVPLTQTREISFDDIENPFEDEFNPHSKKNRKVKFKVQKSSKSSKSSKSKPSVAEISPDTLGGSSGASGSEVSVGSVRIDRPFLQSTGTAQSTRSITTMSTKTSRSQVLVAEDNSVNQEVIKRMLNLEGLTDIDLACDGNEAFEKVQALVGKGEHYDIIFMDVQMPKVDGLLATKMIRQNLNYSYPIVALTAYADDGNIKECLDAGMDGFLSKPIKRPRLKTILQEFYNRPGTMGESRPPTEDK